MIFTDPSPDSEYENVLQPDIHLMTKHNYGRATGRSRKPTCELLKCQHAHSACHELPTLGLSPPKTRLCLIHMMILGLRRTEGGCVSAQSWVIALMPSPYFDSDHQCWY